MSNTDRLQRHTQEHEQLSQLIPWYINGTLSEQEAARVREHLESCIACYGELKFQREVAGVIGQQDVDKEAVSHHFSNLRRRIDAGVRSNGQGTVSIAAMSESPDHSTVRRYGAVSMAAVIVSATVGLLWLQSTEDPITEISAGDYQTLSSSDLQTVGAAGEFFIAFRQDTPEPQISEIFRAHGIAPVSRTDDKRLWRVRLDVADQRNDVIQETIVDLRSRESVLFVDLVISGE